MKKDNNQIYLDGLVGHKVLNVDISIDEFYPIAEKNQSKETTIVATIINFDGDFRLIIDNPHYLRDGNESISLSDLIGHRLIDALEKAENITLVFENDLILVIDMRDEAYSGPEALCLYGPHNLCIVWN